MTTSGDPTQQPEQPNQPEQPEQPDERGDEQREDEGGSTANTNADIALGRHEQSDEQQPDE